MPPAILKQFVDNEQKSFKLLKKNLTWGLRLARKNRAP
jgi:hypothetical protein